MHGSRFIALAILLGPLLAGAQPPASAPYYRSAADAYQQAANNPRTCPENRACYQLFANYYNGVAAAHAPGGSMPAAPSCRIVFCASSAAAGAEPARLAPNAGVSLDGGANGLGSVWAPGTPPAARATVEMIGALGGILAAGIEARARANDANFQDFTQRQRMAEKQEQCYEHFGFQMWREPMRERGPLSCRLQFSILPRFPILRPPELCDSAGMKHMLSRAAAALMDGSLAVAAQLYTEAWLAAPDWAELGIARALVLEAMGDPAAAAAIAPFLGQLANKPSWSIEAQRKAQDDIARCLSAVERTASKRAKLDAGFDPDSCGRHP